MGPWNCQCEGIGELTSGMPAGVLTSRAMLLLIINLNLITMQNNRTEVLQESRFTQKRNSDLCLILSLFIAKTEEVFGAEISRG